MKGPMKLAELRSLKARSPTYDDFLENLTGWAIERGLKFEQIEEFVNEVIESKAIKELYEI